MNIDYLISIVKQNHVDSVHPGYGFLSESDEFAKRMWEEAGVVVVGPGWGILSNTGDKLKARQLAEECKSIQVVLLNDLTFFYRPGFCISSSTPADQ